MALAQPSQPERGPSPGLPVNLSSNNPFRNRAVSPPNAFISPHVPGPTLGLNFEKPATRNPFLDAAEIPASAAPAVSTTMAATNSRNGSTKPALTSHTAELFEALSFEDKPGQSAPPPYQANGSSQSRAENVPPRSAAPPGSRMPPPSHKHTSSREEDRRRRRDKPRPQEGELNIFADPSSPKRREPHARRNSESSMMDRASKLLDPADDEKRRRERRHREREARHKSKSKTPSRRLDVIDKLDVTSIYGMGLVHHDGPFDACNPHRNRKGARAAPMHAFAKDSKNMSLGGSGPLRSKIDLAQFNGTETEGYRDYSQSAAVEDGYTDAIKRPMNARSESFNPTYRVEPVHGDLSVGLGTSTFLEGAPASRAAIQRRESEQEAAQTVPGGGGLSRKMSLAQKIRGNINNRIPGPRAQTPDERFERTTSPTSPRAPGASKPAENNPYFKDYDDEYEKKGAQIQVAEDGNKTRNRAPSSPRRAFPSLERRFTNDSIGGGEEAKTTGGGGFLSRVKSLKGGRRMRPERRETSR